MAILVLTSILAFYLAWNLGANDVANSMGTAVGSKAITLREALIIAGIFEFTGAVLFGRRVSDTIATDIIDLNQFAQTPNLFRLGMIAVLIACGMWLNVATALGLPVSSSHAVVGAIAGFGWVAIGTQAVNWPSLGVISATWVFTPVVSGLVAAGFYRLIQHWILEHPHPLAQLDEWTPWLSAGVFTIFGVLVLPSLSSALQDWGLPLPAQDLLLLGAAMATFSFTVTSWRSLQAHTPALTKTSLTSPSSPPLPPLPLSPPLPSLLLVEQQLARFQVLSACFVAFAHGSNDVGNAIAPLAAIVQLQATGKVPVTDLSISLWILVLGGIGIVAGLAIWGKNVITTVGEGITSLQPSAGFCAELATAATVLLASQLGLPVSTSHALVGGVIGVGLVRSQQQHTLKLRLDTIQGIVSAWLVTIPIAAALSAGVFTLLCHIS